MYLLKISLLLFYTAFHVHTSNVKKTPKPWQYNSRKVNRPIDDQNNCICYPEGQLPTVHELLDSQNNGQERIVIYLYKNVGSDEIKMYIPNIDKQVHIPDIPYEAGDILVTVNNEPINSIFYNNLRIKVYNDRLETFNPESTNSLPIGLNLGAIEHFYPNDINSLAPDYGNHGNEYDIGNIPYGENGIINSKPYITPINNGPNNVIWNEWNILEGDSNVNPELIKEQWWPNNIKYHNHQTPSDKQNTNIGGLSDNVFTFEQNYGSYHSNSPEDWNNPLSNTYIPFNIWFNQQMKSFQGIKLPRELKFIDTIVLKSLVLKTLSENNIHVSSDGIITDSKGLVIDAANLELRPLLIGEKVDHQILQSSLKSVLLPKHLPYLEGILVTLVYPPHVLGIIPLGKTFLPSTSILGNSKIHQPLGLNSSDIYNYIKGNTAFYSDVNRESSTLTVKEIYSGTNKGPVSSLAYSSGNGEPRSYSISNIHTEPSSSSYSYSSDKMEPYWVSNNQENLGVTEVSYWNSGSYISQPEGSYLNSNWNPSAVAQPLGERRKLSEVKIEHHIEPSKQKRKKKGKGLTTEKPKITHKAKVKGNVSKDDNVLKPLTGLNTTESGRRFPQPSLQGVMKTLLFLLNDLPSRRDNKLDFNSTEEVDIPNGSENLNGGERPDFRIIGGNAATGSGTPLSNKGRSGYNKFI